MVAGDRPATLEPQADFPTNLGGLCSKGWNATSLLDHPERLLTPLVRAVRGDRTSPLRPATWEEALGQVVDGIRTAQRDHGLDAVGCFGGGGLTNEKAYAFGKFARVALRTAMIDYNGRFCMSSAATASNRAFGIDRGLPFPLADVADAGAILLVGWNPAATMPPAMQFFDAGRAEGAKHIVVDPRRTATAAGASLHLQPVPGTDLALANGMLHLAVREGWVDTAYLDHRTTGYASVRAGVSAYWPDRVERITGVPVADLYRATEWLAQAPSAMVLTARGAEQHSRGTDTAQAFLNLALALGLPGPARPRATARSPARATARGAASTARRPTSCPATAGSPTPPTGRTWPRCGGSTPTSCRVPACPPSRCSTGSGTPGGVRALIVMASNIAVSAPDAGRVRHRLEALDHLVVSDIFLSETAELADVVLPTAQWAEEEGTMTNLEGRVLRRRRALPPPEGVVDDLTVIKLLADRLGRGDHFSADPRTVFDELRRASAGGLADYSGITYERISAEQGVFWPCPAEDHPGTPRLFADRFATPDGRARLIRVDWAPAAETPDAAYPVVLTTGRLMTQYQSGTQTRRVPALAQATAQPEAQLHPDLARSLLIAPGDVVELTSRRGQASFRARVDPDIRPDTVFVPFHWGGVSAANALTNPVLDPLSRMPAFKACAVRVARIGSGDDLHLLTTTPGRVGADAAHHQHRPPRKKDPRMITTNVFLQGIYPFEGAGMDKPVPIHADLVHVVPDGVVAQALYFRGGNTTGELVTVVLMRDGIPMRYFPIGAKGDVHVALRVVEDIDSGSVVELHLVAPITAQGMVVLDLGMVEH